MSKPTYRYQPKPPVKLVAEKLPTIIDVQATEVATETKEEARERGRAEEALAVTVQLWDDLMALEDTKRKNYRKRTSGTDHLLLEGQMMGVKSAIQRHLQRHAQQGVQVQQPRRLEQVTAVAAAAAHAHDHLDVQAGEVQPVADEVVGEQERRVGAVGAGHLLAPGLGQAHDQLQ